MKSPQQAATAQAGTAQAEVSISGSPGFWEWLEAQQISLGFTTYQSNRLFLLGRKAGGRLAVNERLFDKPMGLYAQGDSLYMACRYQIWQLDNHLAPGQEHRGCDRLYTPSLAHTTGDLNVHDVVLDKDGQLLFVNTDFSCLARLRPGYSFEPVWQPPFISKLAAEDRCHLNGLAMQDGEPMYVSACSATDQAAGWRNHRVEGGVAIHVASKEIVAHGLSMPHSPRLRQGKLWLLNSGMGELGFVDGGRFHASTFLPGFVRGLAFHGDFALVGLSRLRSKTFAGLGLESRLAAMGQSSQCGLAVVDLNSGAVLHRLQIEGVVEELFDVVVLPGVRQPSALGFQDDDIDRLVSFPGSMGIVVTKPTVVRPGLGPEVQKAGLPRPSQNQHGTLARQAAQEDLPAQPIEQPQQVHQDQKDQQAQGAHALSHPPEPGTPIKFQQVFHLNPDNLLAYESMTRPSLQQRWKTHPQRGELLGVSASVAGDMVGFAIAELYGQPGARQAELLSLKVLPGFDQAAIEARLLRHLQKLVGQPLAFSPAAIT